MKYRIGQKVVYIGADYRRHPIVIARGEIVPVPQAVYTVRGSMPLIDGPNAGLPGYVFEEFHNTMARNPLTGDMCETMWTDEPFLRPLTDISVFEKLRKEIEAGGHVGLVRDAVT